MAKHLHYFETESEFNQAYNGESYDEPWVSATHLQTNYRVNYNKSEDEREKLLKTPVSLEFIGNQSGTIKANIDGIYYSLDNGSTWNLFDTETTTLSVSPGTKLLLKGDIHDTSSACEGAFLIRNIQFNAYGNIMSLYDSTGFSGRTTFDRNSDRLPSLFYMTPIVSAENLILPVTALTENCYKEMFSSCNNLTTPPELPATTLAYGCYYGMFDGCTSLTTAPELPATTLAEACYNCMFNSCSSLTTAPELPATTLAAVCYERMLSYCTGLTTAPELPATTLAPGCYSGMFFNSTNLNYIKCLATDISEYDCTLDWVNGVQTNSGTFIAYSCGLDWTYGSNIPSNWTVYDKDGNDITNCYPPLD